MTTGYVESTGMKAKRHTGRPVLDFYSARLLYIVLVKDGKARKRNLYDECTFIYRARDSEHAVARAFEIGRAQEARYKNKFDQEVRWALVELLDIIRLGKKVDGVEVASRLHDRVSSRPVSFAQRFAPERSAPWLNKSPGGTIVR
jgi:hypothetical protein